MSEFKTVLTNPSIPINVIKLDRPDCYMVEGDTSYSKGGVRFSHEFTFTVMVNDKAAEFLGGWDIACEDIDYKSGKDGLEFFETMPPGLFNGTVAAIRSN